jgi:hypothetical protein
MTLIIASVPLMLLAIAVAVLPVAYMSVAEARSGLARPSAANVPTGATPAPTMHTRGRSAPVDAPERAQATLAAAVA